ncbi:LLM class flavin-dependent oxidoreductase [Agromyces atrinae]|uniref:5,10-methylenetetrahydromethanopterin reductase n=1 Tax=Agromyces atrinae TaxID=592376 RepID=A0A4Q2MCC5_9MICO|nr:LLM class flavin-dependent oxidoreductase [Agromyces atrinae]NYD68101.1 5,10-methylenetetrahydromethanopterin reductase [Agromyces atrinae]RXZ87751.1 LLM class flavin-dependent oxidoreductase [Agromyces atrinae]
MTRFSLRVNNDLDLPTLTGLAVAAEDAGIDQLWVSNDLMMRSAPALLGALFQKTSRIELGIGIMNPFSVHPAELAMTAATLAEMSGGRFNLGLAAGSGEFLSWVGIDQQKPLTATREALRAIRALLAGERPVDVEGAGAGWTRDAYLRLDPVHVPIYIGAMSPKMLEFAGAEADGVLALLFPPEHFETASALVATGAESAGRTLADVDMPACVWLALDDDREKADRALALKLAYYGGAFSPYLLARAGLETADFQPALDALRDGDEERAIASITPQMLSLGISGDPETVIRRCRRLQELGATHLSFGPPLGPDPVGAIELLGQSVLPELRRSA